jgi:hypothetical protein
MVSDRYIARIVGHTCNWGGFRVPGTSSVDIEIWALHDSKGAGA